MMLSCWLLQAWTYSMHWGVLQLSLKQLGWACTLQIGGEVLPQVEEFKYLGVLFTSEGRMDREIDRWIGAAAAVMRSMYRSVVVKKELSRKAKLSIYQSIYVPTLNYGHELWIMTERLVSDTRTSQSHLANNSCMASLSLALKTLKHSRNHTSEVSVTSPINLFIIVIYRPPGPLGDFLEEMDTLLSVFPSDNTPLTVLGDFNLPSDKLHSSGLLALLNSFSLSFNSCPPTHKEGNVLDLVFTHPSPVTDMTATPLHTSDHHLVSFTITLPILPKHNSQHLALTRRNLHSISPSSVASCTLSSLPDHDSFSSLPLDSATDTLFSSLSSTMDLLCPFSTIHKKNSSTAPWLSDVLRNNQRELRSAARKWTQTSLPTSSTSHSQHSATPSLTQLSTVAAEEVLQITRSCNPTTCPLDPIPSAMLQTISPDLLPFITTVINGSLTSGHVPTVFKKARVIPILKKPALDPSE
ncbi:hypothetical protein QTP70_020094 [Hemibagrus guttatus]|uniref:Endonuclease/exonuclease/phosphatase domain-containing protein n=1 Tax=Hemibagrus guttatus TaxID=175788 RepID=A0AAE0RH37_9TELE|nr:hypothetical protein QTP70_020094 [Hemibagrus guttatus]